MAHLDPTIIPGEGEEEEEEEEDMLDAADAEEEVEMEEDQPMEEAEEDDAGPGDDIQAEINLQNDSLAHFDLHTDSIFTIAAHPIHPNIIATGAGDDTVYVFSSQVDSRPLPASYETNPQANGTGRDSIEPITQLKGHKDSVIALAFTRPSGQYLLTAGMDGQLRAYNTTSTSDPTSAKSYAFLSSVQEVEEITWLAINPSSNHPNTFALGANDGSVWVYNIPVESTDLVVLQAYYQHQSPCTAGTWSVNGALLATVSEEGSLLVFDPFGLAPDTPGGGGTGAAIVARTAEDQRFAVEGGLYCVAISPGGTLCAVGGAAGSIRIVGLPRITPATTTQANTTKSQKGGAGTKAKAAGGKQSSVSGTTAQAGGSGQAGQLVASLQAQTDSVETLAFSSTGALLAAGSVDGSIALFDVAHNFALRRHIREAHEEHAAVRILWEGADLGAAIRQAQMQQSVGGGGAQQPVANAAGSTFFSCGMDGVLRKWDARTGTLLKEWKGHRGGGEGGGIMGFVLGKDDEGRDFAVTAGDDGVSLVFDVTA